MKKLLFKSVLSCTLLISSIACMQDSSEKFCNGRLVTANNTSTPETPSTVQRLKNAVNTLIVFVLPLTYAATNPLMKDWHCTKESQDWNICCSTYYDLTALGLLTIPAYKVAHKLYKRCC